MIEPKRHGTSEKELTAMKSNLPFVTATVLAFLWISGPSLGQGPPPEVIVFERTTGWPVEAPGVYPRVYSGRVEFPHGEHFSDYDVACGDCHHADSFDSGTGMKTDVEITPCVECHDAAGLVYGRRVDEVDQDDLVAHRANAMHSLCVGCHEESSARRLSIVAPIACRGCHAQRQPDYVIQDSEAG